MTDAEAFDAAYEEHFEYVYRSLARLGVAPRDVPDAVHDVFVVAYQRWSELDRDRSLRPWLFGVARRVASGRRSKRAPELGLDTERALGSPAAAPDAIAARDLAWRLLAELPDERREVVILHDMEGHTGAEIAALLDIPTNTVHSRLRLARAELAAAYDRLAKARGPR